MGIGMHSLTYRDLKIKTINDKFTILINEILNLISVANYMDENTKDKNSIEKLDEIEEILKNTPDDLEKRINQGIYEIEKINIKERKNNKAKEIDIAIETLIYLLKRCKYGLDYINKYFNQKETSPIDDLLLFSFLEEKEILNILSNINVISKLLKFRRENAQQIYIPSSLLHRRYRLYNNQKLMNNLIYNKITKFLERNKNIFDSSKNGNISFLLTSDYDIGETLDVKNTKNLTLIKGSFFWRELFRFQPLIFHEIGHTMQNFLNEKIREKYEEFAEQIFIATEDSYNDLFSLEDLNMLKDEIFVDTICTYMLGDAYILSLVNYGLLGLHFYETIADTENNKTDVRKIYYKFQDLNIRFTAKREKHILRFKFLLKLREILERRKNLQYKFTLISKELREDLENYISDLFPFDKVGVSFFYASEENKNQLEFIANYIDYLVQEFLDFFETHLRFQPELDEKSNEREKIEMGEGIYTINKNIEEGIFYIITQEESKLFSININLDDRNNDCISKNDVEISRLQKNNVPDFNEATSIDIYNLMWKIALIQMQKNKESEENAIFEKSLKDGRVFGTYQITTYQPYVNLLNNYFDNFGTRLCLDVGFLGFVKGKNFYIDSEQNGNNNLKDNITKYIENIKSYRIENDFNYMMGPHDLYILKIAHTKRIEKDIYLPLIENKAFVDIHSILKIDWNKAEEGKDNKLIKKLWAFSFGWEDIILYERDLNNIFKIKSYIQDNKQEIGIKRTETLISYFENNEFEAFILTKLKKNNINFNKEILNENEQYDYNLFINLRIKDIKKENCTEDNAVPDLFSNLEGYQFPGRYDLILYNKYNLEKEKLKEFIEKILSMKVKCIYPFLLKKNDKIANLEDMVLDIVKLEKNNFISQMT